MLRMLRQFKAGLERQSKIQALIQLDREKLGEATYDFYRCSACGRLITRLEEIAFMDPNSVTYGKVCISCGSSRYSPVNLSLKHWLLPRVWWFALLRLFKLA